MKLDEATYSHDGNDVYCSQQITPIAHCSSDEVAAYIARSLNKATQRAQSKANILRKLMKNQKEAP